MSGITLELGVRIDPTEDLYSYEWILQLMQEEEIRCAQLASFFGLYQLTDASVLELKARAEHFGVSFTSISAVHRELCGLFRPEKEYQRIATGIFERLVDIGALLEANSVGINVPMVPRHGDTRQEQQDGFRVRLGRLKDLVHRAQERGIDTLTVEHTTLDQRIAEELDADGTCTQIEAATIRYSFDTRSMATDRMLTHVVPQLHELHLRNTDLNLLGTFGFSERDRTVGIVDIPKLRQLLVSQPGGPHQRWITGYAEVAGPKPGGSHLDKTIQRANRESLRYLRETFVAGRPSGTSTRSRRQRPEHGGIRISPSLMCADLCNAEDAVEELRTLGVDMLHFDIMDARFTSNLPLGLELMRQLRRRTALPFDVHLMVEDNEFFVNEVLRIGVWQLSVHAESATHLDRILGMIRETGTKAGVALNPATPIDHLEYVLEKLDFVMLMTVNPGFSGQRLVDSAFRKIRTCRTFLAERGLPIPIEVDGNVSFQNIPAMVASGAETLVCGSSSLFSAASSLSDSMSRLRASIADGLSRRAAPPRQAQ